MKRSTSITVLLLLACTGAASQPRQQTPADRMTPERRALVEAIVKACTDKYGERTPDMLSCTTRSAARFDRDDHSPPIEPIVACMRMGGVVACN
jgi:hypothetical protein